MVGVGWGWAGWGGAGGDRLGYRGHCRRRLSSRGQAGAGRAWAGVRGSK